MKLEKLERLKSCFKCSYANQATNSEYTSIRKPSYYCSWFI